MEPKTTIAITKKIRDQLASLGTKNSTFDDIVKLLLNKWNVAK